jgi:predicted aspartyl protease
MIEGRWLSRSKMADVGIFRTTVGVESVSERGRVQHLPDTLVDTGSEFTWIPRSVLESLGIKPERRQGFIVADGRRIDREIGFAIVHAGGVATADDVVFAEDSDLVLLGVRSLEGLNLRVDVVGKRLVEAGPILAACGSRAPIAPREGTPKRWRPVTHS